jgi:hypothetical protein
MRQKPMDREIAEQIQESKRKERQEKQAKKNTYNIDCS